MAIVIRAIYEYGGFECPDLDFIGLEPEPLKY
jgi:hypothetical protein